MRNTIPWGLANVCAWLPFREVLSVVLAMIAWHCRHKMAGADSGSIVSRWAPGFCTVPTPEDFSGDLNNPVNDNPGTAGQKQDAFMGKARLTMVLA
jgi:hypothetical protein